MISNILGWFEKIIYSSKEVYDFFSFKISIGGYTFSPFLILTIGGLTTYLGVAVIKWIVS